jgi:AcrR family transcriptional regulator
MTGSQLKRAIAPEAKLERRAGILAAAAALLHKDPRAGFSMGALAARAGLAKGTVYLYFSTREEVLLAVHEKHVHELFDAFESALDAPDADPSKVLAAGIRYYRDRPESYSLAGNCHNLTMFRIDFERQLAAALADLWEGALRRAAGRQL